MRRVRTDGTGRDISPPPLGRFPFPEGSLGERCPGAPRRIGTSLPASRVARSVPVTRPTSLRHGVASPCVAFMPHCVTRAMLRLCYMARTHTTRVVGGTLQGRHIVALHVAGGTHMEKLSRARVPSWLLEPLYKLSLFVRGSHHNYMIWTKWT